MRSISTLFLASLLIISPALLLASPFPEGEKNISLVNAQGEHFDIGKITFARKDNQTSYNIEFTDSVFNDEFLSMRPFKCIHLPNDEMLCHLVYPYTKKGYIEKDDLMDLEYDLLFLRKSKQEYGINAWNGLFYQLNMTSNGFDGQLMEVDLNILAGPPENGELRPISRDMLYEADPAVHSFPRIIIQ